MRTVVHSLRFLCFVVFLSACSRSWGRSVPAGSPRPPTDPSDVSVYVSVPPNRNIDTVGYVVAVGTDSDVAALRLREEAARLGASAVVDVELRITYRTVEVSGRAVRWQ